MNTRTKRTIGIVLGVVIVLIAGYLVWTRTTDRDPLTPFATPTKGGGYENRYMTLDVAAGWKLAESQSVPGAVSITKDNWVLYINPAATQASGVEGGRFDEYAAGAAGVELVMGDLAQPRDGSQCAAIVTKPGVATIENASVPRHDYYAPSQTANAECNIPASGAPIWFFATIGNRLGNNLVSSVTEKQVVAAPNGFPERLFVISMTYQAATPEELPRRGSKELSVALGDMAAIVSTLVFK